MPDVQNATYSSHGVPCLARDLLPMDKHEIESTYICMDNTRISEKTFFVPLGFGGYLLTIDYDNNSNQTEQKQINKQTVFKLDQICSVLAMK